VPNSKIDRENISFWLRVKPRAAHERLTEGAAGELRLEVARARHGRPSQRCLRHFFARALRLPQACVVILSGLKARRKLIRVTGRSQRRALRRLERQ